MHTYHTVLDATDGQAQTQIGTPYYLSPEICDSRPYGRKSDVWSLGVVLFELLATELPFQATSLPALIVKICTAQPPWEKLSVGGGVKSQQRYSDAAVALMRSMLEKSPESRPLVRDVVRGEYVKSHISRLLSHTLKAGNGGAPAAAPPSIAADSKCVEELEQRQEMRRKEEQRKVQSEVMARQEKQHAREEEMEKLKVCLFVCLFVLTCLFTCVCNVFQLVCQSVYTHSS